MSITLQDLPLGPLEQHIATLPVDAKRIKGLTGSTLTGQVNSDASTAAGSGWTAATGATGIYTITFTTAFAATPTVVATAINTSTGMIAQIGSSISASAVEIRTRNDSGTLTNSAFHFVAFATV